jgi:hypothetical protein
LFFKVVGKLVSLCLHHFAYLMVGEGELSSPKMFCKFISVSLPLPSEQGFLRHLKFDLKTLLGFGGFQPQERLELGQSYLCTASDLWAWLLEQKGFMLSRAVLFSPGERPYIYCLVFLGWGWGAIYFLGGT